ncbi:MAG: ABC transporter ATP-binding protein [Ruminococcaceae bacterium]|nr:ABC transporter ATP-binding protein [Oscillospiraceae bacterium]
MSEKLLEIENLHVHYVVGKDVVKAVNGINLKVDKGETLGLVGETGAGKTTTALALLRLLPTYTGKIPEGSIQFEDVDVLKMNKKALRAFRGGSVSMIFQDPMTSLNPVMMVGKQIGEVVKLHNKEMTKEDVEQRVDEMLELVGIPKQRKNEYPHQFSGGMKQRVMIAIAIACQPALLIADEPTTALDVTIQAQVLNMMRNLKSRLNSAMIMITHDMGVVASICDKVAIMYAGEIVEYGTLRDIFDSSLDHHPYTIGLFNSIPLLNERTDRLQPIDGLMPDPSNLPSGCKFHPRCKSCMEDKCLEGNVPVFEKDGHQIKCVLFQ